MSLIQGVNGLFPCPCCLVHNDQQRDPSAHAAAWTSGSMQATVQDAREQRFVKDKEEILKSAGLRDVDVFIISLFVLCPYSVVSNRMCFGRLNTQTHMQHYPLIASTPSLVAYSGTISGRVFKLMWNYWVGRLALQSTSCVSHSPLSFWENHSQWIKVLTVSHHGGDLTISKTTSMRTSWMGPNGRTCQR